MKYFVLLKSKLTLYSKPISFIYYIWIKSIHLTKHEAKFPSMKFIKYLAYRLRFFGRTIILYYYNPYIRFWTVAFNINSLYSGVVKKSHIPSNGSKESLHLSCQ